MSFYTNLRKVLKSKLNAKELDMLPRSYQILGKIMLIKLRPGLREHRNLIGDEILNMFPYLHTVCLIKGINKTRRKPDVEIIAGLKSTQTLHKEHKCEFLLDVAEIMWSKGNKDERIRLTKLAKPKEIIVDMFAGIGYFSIFLAKYSKPEKIYSIDINPKAIEFLRRNIWLNDVENKVEILEGDCRKFSKILENTADRIVMGHLFETEKFLPHAFSIAKDKCVIHMHRIAKINEINKIKEEIPRNVIILRTKKIKSYSPKTCHYVFDLRFRKL